MVFKFTVSGKPMGKQRPKATIRGHHAGVYTPKETVAYERYVVAMFLQAYPCARPLEGEIKGKIKAFYPIPQSTSKKRKTAMLNGVIRPQVKPDLDNVEKIIYDALNGVAYTDDSHITEMTISKYYSDEPRVEIMIEEER
ncbi:MAG: RusA family crossover junction endodeoxyribonuclease [Erysipelotrichaceae bacterium]|nr:RusA family crossover junction endodeoxyribonuclease [Erysipelotrichaceae bacterium]